MSVKVNQLTKTYGGQKAVDNISFEAGTGVLGFLGPNGAGKSTTMKILACFLPQTSGTAAVCGFDVRDAPSEVKKRTGYLPESNALYPDMYVHEFLEFVAAVHGIREKKARIRRIIDLTGMGMEQKKKIRALSKGYRQRLGLAQAMIHDPEVLILDEPTSGLDPNQLVEIREVIRDMGKTKTVIFSSHILQEVTAVCSRVLIISNGTLVADDSIANLSEKMGGQTVITVRFKEPVTRDQLMKISSVSSAGEAAGGAWELASSSREAREHVFRFAVEKKLTILDMRQEERSLEDVFRHLTSPK